MLAAGPENKDVVLLTWSCMMIGAGKFGPPRRGVDDMLRKDDARRAKSRLFYLSFENVFSRLEKFSGLKRQPAEARPSKQLEMDGIDAWRCK